MANSQKCGMRINVFGRHIEVIRRQGCWAVYYLGPEGKKRFADDIIIPAALDETEILAYVADLCHEWQTEVGQTVSFE